MSYKTILLHVHDPRRTLRAIEAATVLAREMVAHLIGLAVLPPYVAMPAMEGIGASISVDEHRKAFRKDMEQLRAMFEAATSELEPPAEWREADAEFGTVPDEVLKHARTADLIVAAPLDPGQSRVSLFEDPERLVMESGRPVLLVPGESKAKFPPRRITVAWDDRREAARAVFDALPLIERASDVDVVTIDPERTGAAAGELPGTEIAIALARHGVRCQTVEASAGGGDVGTALLRQAAVSGSDLLIMGCYGHSRVREFILGGASRHVLGNVSMPVLMSH